MTTVATEGNVEVVSKNIEVAAEVETITTTRVNNSEFLLLILSSTFA